jgi:hypothetical protein
VRARVTRLREDGVPIPEKDKKPVEGVLVHEERASLGYVVALVADQDRALAPLISPMIRTFLVGFGRTGFTLSGLEAEDDSPKSMGPLYMQQWLVEPLIPAKAKKGKATPEVEEVEEVETVEEE